ncbi:DUF4097 family beta strand repeat-containing protein [Arthrobacter sp. H5]|uniref:DUF4097 family beta strand repeat-containing protein n=1 Tax=Arthrobacter sp. H5 TaxID=1267973 RepID=UPI000487E802|nr:DUF4097 family beta strand repeat-containing protein [Arthrobacter sp. H5]
MPVFDTPQPISVTLELAIGSARIIAGATDRTSVEVLPSRESKPADIKAAEHTRVEYSGGQLRVISPKNWKHYTPFGGSGSVDVTIELPAGSAVHGESAVGEFHAEGRLGECTLTSGVGDISLEETGPLTVKTGTGDITADRIAGHAEIITGSGSVRIRTIDGSAELKNSNGHTAIGDVTGEIRLRGANGDISVDRAHSSIVAKTAHGKVRIGEIMRGSALLESSFGKLDLGIRNGTAAWLDVTTQHGKVRNSLTADSGPTEADETAEVRARTSWGDITIRRSTESANS